MPRTGQNKRIGLRGWVAEAPLPADAEAERPHRLARAVGCGRNPVKGTVEIEHFVDTEVQVLPGGEVVRKSGIEIQPRHIRQERRIILVVFGIDVLRPCRRADVVDSGAGAIGKSLGFEAGGSRDPDRRIEQLARPAETNERAALQCLAAAGTEELRIGVEQSRSQNIERELRCAGCLLDTGRGSENVVLRDRRFLICVANIASKPRATAPRSAGRAMSPPLRFDRRYAPARHPWPRRRRA
jgi:hypothetical protein